MNKIPRHVAIIMDGNGRWAKKRFVNTAAGHRAGAQTLKQIARECEALKIEYLTVYAFSTENWKRSASEVSDLMNLLREYIKQYIDDVDKNEVRIRVIGDLSRLDLDLQGSIQQLQDQTKHKEGLCLVLAINYGSRDEITRAVKSISRDLKNHKLSDSDLNETLIESYLDTKDIPNPDLLIKPGGEMRLSNFLLWQMAYSELYFTKKLWPDFNKKDLLSAIEEYSQRDRRFGGR